MAEKGSFNNWREIKRLKLMSDKFIDVRSTELINQIDIIVDRESAMSIKRQIGKKEIVKIVNYHGVVFPSEQFCVGYKKYSTDNCINSEYVNFFVFQDEKSVDWYILSPNFKYNSF